MNFIPGKDPLAGIPRPSMLIETRPNGDSTEIFAGDAADLRHNFWVLQSDDPLKVRGARAEIDWRFPVGLGGALLTSPSHAHDLATAKICVVEMASNRIRHSVSAAGISSRVQRLMWLYRWRLEIGVQRLDVITPAMFKDFRGRLKRGGLSQLIGLQERLDHLAKAVREGEWSWPVNGPESGFAYAGKVSYVKLAEEIGTTDQLLKDNQDLVLNSVRLSNLDMAGGGAVQLEAVEPGDNQNGFNLSTGYAKSLLWPWDYLSLLSSNGTLTHDRLTFDPFAKTTVENVARMIAGPNAAELGEKRTRTLTPRELLSLLDHATRWVLDYSKPVISVAERAAAASSIIRWYPGGSVVLSSRNAYREELSKILAEHKQLYHERMPDLLPMWKRASNPERGVAIYEALVCVVASCFIVIAAFSARRKREIQSLKVGCAAKDQLGYTWLWAYIEKTLRDIDQIPVPPLVLEAVRILEELGREGRETTGEPWLGDIRVTSPSLTANLKGGGYTYIEKNFGELIFKFCQVLETLNPDLGGLEARPHEFRRAFAVMYYHGNRYATFDALSRFLRHFDPEMTRRYVTEGAAGRLAALARRTAAEGEIAVERKAMAQLVAENIKEQAALVEEVRQEAFIERALEVFDGTENPIGHGANTLRAELNMLADIAHDRIQLGATGNGSPDEVRTSVADLLRKHAQTHYLEPHPGKHAHCRCRPNNEEDLLKAACLIKKAAATGEAGKRPDYAFSTVRDCLGCYHGIVLSENKRVLSERAETYAEAAEKGSSDPVRIAAQDKLARLKASIRDAEEASRRGSRA